MKLPKLVFLMVDCAMEMTVQQCCKCRSSEYGSLEGSLFLLHHASVCHMYTVNVSDVDLHCFFVFWDALRPCNRLSVSLGRICLESYKCC